MDSNLQSRPSDDSDVKPSFLKLSNDTAIGKYCPRSRTSGSPSSSSDGENLFSVAIVFLSLNFH